MGWTKKQGETIKNVLSRLHAGRACFLYTGLTARDDVLILGTHAEADFKYGDPKQTVGVVHLKTEEIKTLIHSFLSHFKISLVSETPMIYDLSILIAIANNTKWTLQDVYTFADYTSLHLEIGGKRVLVGQLMNSFYTYTQLERMTQEVYRAIFDQIPHYDVLFPYNKDKPRVFKMIIKGTLLKDTPLDSFFTHDYGFLVTHGIETLQASLHHKENEKNNTEYKYGLRLWSEDGTSLRFGGYYSDPSITFIGTRVYAFLVKSLRGRNDDGRSSD